MKYEEQQTFRLLPDLAAVRCEQYVSALHPIVYNQGTALTVLGLDSAILEGPSCLSCTLAGEWEGDRWPTGSRDLPERRSSFCEAMPLLPFL